MTLAEYLAESGRGELSRLQRETKLAYSTLHALAKGKGGRVPTATPKTAKAIEDATGGKVTAAELLGLTGEAAA